MVGMAMMATANAQGPTTGRYHPLDQHVAPGVAGRWSAMVRRDAINTFQMIRVELPGDGGRVAVYTGADGGQTDLSSSAQASILVGPVYRLRISDLSDFPGVELYPTVELLDRLHPPAGREAEFPVPIVFTEQEIQFALQGRLVTKVVFLEQPDRASPARSTTASRVRVVEPRENPLAVADENGRPMAIVRLGSRVPDANAPDSGFYGTCAPVVLPNTESEPRTAARGLRKGAR